MRDLHTEMRNRKLTMAIDSGATTCASSVGRFCRYVRSERGGMKWVCGLFDNNELSAVPGETGWLQRLPECIEAEKT